ncbi:hypothetical protein LCGC14_0549770 [marine sediment metagenome]|uniref:Uncharacterized protein n=1 Tax=marine sediment metagenome TaxID=412755 RepID=A0A0F9RQC4_9ZZZZ
MITWIYTKPPSEEANNKIIKALNAALVALPSQFKELAGIAVRKHKFNGADGMMNFKIVYEVREKKGE